jgi:hypothetical protein
MKNHYENTEFLMQSVKEKIGKPVSSRVVIATIESLGIRDIDVPIDYGFESIKSLADYIFKEINSLADYSELKNVKEKEDIEKHETIQVSDYVHIKARLFAKHYPLGILHLLPVFLQITAIILFGYSLWTYIGFNEIQSTAVVLGVMAGLIITGGFVQVIGRQATFYWNYEDYQMAKETIFYLIKKGTKSLLFVVFIVSFFNIFFHLFPFEILLVIFIYAFLIGLLLLVFAPLHTIRQRWVISVAILAGTALAVLAKEKTDLLIFVTHWIGISCAIIISFVFLYFFFKFKIKKKQIHTNIRFKTPILLYQNYKYFFYGTAVYIFIFIDRILAWTSDTEGKLPLIVYFEKDYELGMDLAILVFLLMTGVLEYSIVLFTKFLDIGQKTTSFNSPEKFNKQFIKMYWHAVLLLIFTCILISILIYYIITASWGYKGQFDQSLDAISIRVCVIAGIGYFFLAWGMLNSLYMFTLGRPNIPVKGIMIACIINIVVGFILSRFVSYEFSVIGMLCGSVFYAYYTFVENRKFFNNLDYYYYAAY